MDSMQNYGCYFYFLIGKTLYISKSRLDSSSFSTLYHVEETTNTPVKGDVLYVDLLATDKILKRIKRSSFNLEDIEEVENMAFFSKKLGGVYHKFILLPEVDNLDLVDLGLGKGLKIIEK